DRWILKPDRRHHNDRFVCRAVVDEVTAGGRSKDSNGGEAGIQRCAIPFRSLVRSTVIGLVRLLDDKRRQIMDRTEFLRSDRHAIAARESLKEHPIAGLL